MEERLIPELSRNEELSSKNDYFGQIKRKRGL